MGYMRHHAVLVTAPSERINSAHAEACRLCSGLVSDIVHSPVNGYASFFVAPDGSKEGWTASTMHDANRAMFLRWLDRQRWSDGSTPYKWAEVQYGDDEGDTHVVAHSEHIAPSDAYDGPADLTSLVGALTPPEDAA